MIGRHFRRRRRDEAAAPEPFSRVRTRTLIRAAAWDLDTATWSEAQLVGALAVIEHMPHEASDEMLRGAAAIIEAKRAQIVRREYSQALDVIRSTAPAPAQETK